MVRTRLKTEGVLNCDARIQAKGDFLMIPITTESFDDYPVEEVDLKAIEHKETDYRLFLPEGLRPILPNSYDNIGDITIIKLIDELLPLKNEIGEALMKVTTNTRAVLLDSGVKGEMRIRDLELIAGLGPTETRHRESGVTMLTDPAKVYFNPRLATERERIASMVKDGEVIIDMFSGVAPFPLIICKHANPEIVYAIDLNHDAVEYMKRNVMMNHVKNIIPIEGDARVEIQKLPDADRIIMNLPQIAEQYLPDALGKTKRGGIIHIHKIMERETSDDECDNMILDMRSRGFVCTLSEKRELKTYSPSASVYVLDIIRG